MSPKKALDGESRCPTLAGWTLATMNVGAVCAVVVAALAARKLVDVLQMIRTGFPGISHHVTGRILFPSRFEPNFRQCSQIPLGFRPGQVHVTD